MLGVIPVEQTGLAGSAFTTPPESDQVPFPQALGPFDVCRTTLKLTIDLEAGLYSVALEEEMDEGALRLHRRIARGLTGR